jgi:hypothetical protein
MNGRKKGEPLRVTRAREEQAKLQPPQLSVSPPSPEFPACHKFPDSPVFPACPVSKGQGLDAQRKNMLKAFAARSACTERNTARKRRWQLARDLRAVEKGIGRELSIDELMVTFDEWHRLSQPFLDPAKTRDDYLAAFLAELQKVRVPTGEGETLTKALEHVSTLSVSALPLIPGMADAPESFRRVAALHRELSRRSTKRKKTYFLSSRDAAKAVPGLSHQTAYNINLTLAQAQHGVIKIVCVGIARPSGGKASEFRYLLSEGENGTQDDDGRFEL